LLCTIVSLALNTALRKNEIQTLRWQKIDLLERTLTVGQTKTQGGSGRVIPLNSVAYKAVVRWASRFPEAKPEDYLFPACEDARLDCQKPDVSKIAGVSKIVEPDAQFRVFEGATPSGSPRLDRTRGIARTLFAHSHGGEASGTRRHREARF
jgi:integrase